MKLRTQAMAIAAVLLALMTHATATPPSAVVGVSSTIRGHLPTEAAAKSILNMMARHREWAEVPAGSAVIRTFVVYPDRANKAPVALVTSRDQGMSDWVRAVSDQVAADGYLAVAPDVRGEEVGRRAANVRDYIGNAIPFANGQFASLDFSQRTDGTTQVDVMVEPYADKARQTASFTVTGDTWSRAMEFLNRAIGNRPIGVPSEQELHAMDMAMGAMAMNDIRDMGLRLDMTPKDALAMDVAEAQTQARAQESHGGAPTNGDDSTTFVKRPDIPASIYTSRATMLHTTLKGEWVNIPVGNVQLHTWISYPAGTGKAPIALVIHGAPGMWEDWPQAVADQMAHEGFIGVAMDLRSGQGPNGGNFDFHFPHLDDGVKPGPELGPDENLRRIKAALDYALKLPRSNGKSASIGFCAGGSLAWQTATEIPELSAAVSYYGNPPNMAALSKINAQVMAFYGEFDGRVTATAPATQAAMEKLGKKFVSVIYPRTTHSFVSQQNLADNFKSLVDSWPKATTFMKEHTM